LNFYIYCYLRVYDRIVYLDCGLISLRYSRIFKITNSLHSFSLVLIRINVFQAHFRMRIVKVLIAFYYAMDVEQPVLPLLENALNTIVSEEDALWWTLSNWLKVLKPLYIDFHHLNEENTRKKINKVDDEMIKIELYNHVLRLSK
jgi:hypothetical protein